MNKKIYIYPIILSLIGCLMIYSSSNIWSEFKYNDPYKYLISQLIFLIISIIAMVIVSKINVKMILIGGNYENSFINDEDIILTGIVNNVEEILSGIDVFVFPSLHEGYGISLVEAQMLKIPCLASDTIPKTTKISNCVEYLNLNLGIETWANKIVELSKVDRNRIKITKINNNYNFKMLLKIFEEC